jgi:hypothetical protein
MLLLLLRANESSLHDSSKYSTPLYSTPDQWHHRERDVRSNRPRLFRSCRFIHSFGSQAPSWILDYLRCPFMSASDSMSAAASAISTLLSNTLVLKTIALKKV